MAVPRRAAELGPRGLRAALEGLGEEPALLAALATWAATWEPSEGLAVQQRLRQGGAALAQALASCCRSHLQRQGRDLESCVQLLHGLSLAGLLDAELCGVLASRCSQA